MPAFEPQRAAPIRSGAGAIAYAHAEALMRLGVEIRGVIDVNRDSAAKLAARCGSRAVDRLDDVVTEDSLEQRAAAEYTFAPELAFLWRFAKALKAARERVRGKPDREVKTLAELPALVGAN